MVNSIALRFLCISRHLISRSETNISDPQITLPDCVKYFQACYRNEAHILLLLIGIVRGIDIPIALLSHLWIPAAPGDCGSPIWGMSLRMWWA